MCESLVLIDKRACTTAFMGSFAFVDSPFASETGLLCLNSMNLRAENL